jgi:hypothetical protein
MGSSDAPHTKTWRGSYVLHWMSVSVSPALPWDESNITLRKPYISNNNATVHLVKNHHHQHSALGDLMAFGDNSGCLVQAGSCQPFYVSDHGQVCSDYLLSRVSNNKTRCVVTSKQISSSYVPLSPTSANWLVITNRNVAIATDRTEMYKRFVRCQVGFLPKITRRRFESKGSSVWLQVRIKHKAPTVQKERTYLDTPVLYYLITYPIMGTADCKASAKIPHDPDQYQKYIWYSQ